MSTLLQDLRFGFRILAKSPGFTAIAVVTLALGIGANTAVFSVVYGMALKPLGYPEQDRLVYLFAANPLHGWSRVYVSCLDFFDWREQNDSFEEMGLFFEQSKTLTGGDRARRVSVVSASAGLLPVLGLEARIGRTFGPEEDQPGKGQVVLLGERFWEGQFGGDPNIVGEVITLDGVPHTVLGILPTKLERAWGHFDVWSPAALDPQAFDRGSRSFRVIGRLGPGISVAQAQAEMEGIAARLAEAHPGSNQGRTVELVPIMEVVLGNEGRAALIALVAAVAFVLLIACVNVANLLLARGIVRCKEFAIRSTLGARRRRLVRQMITEAALLSLAGGALGVLLAVWGVDLLVSALPDDVPRKAEIAVDSHALHYTLLVALVTAVIASLLPAAKVLRVNINDTLKDATPSASAGRSRRSGRDALLVGQVALALALVTSAGLMIRSFLSLRAVDPGFDSQNVLTVGLTLSSHKYKAAAQTQAFFQIATRRIGAIPGVRSAVATTAIPFDGYPPGRGMTIEEYRQSAPRDMVTLGFIGVTPGYFEAMGIPLLSGRGFTEHDTAGSQGVVIVNESAAERYWPGDDPLGKRLKYGRREWNLPWLTVIGVAETIQQAGLSRETGADMYVPLAQAPTPIMGMGICARTVGDPLAISAAVRDAIHEIDADQAVAAIRSLDELLFEEIGAWGVLAWMLGVFATVALVLAVVGLYGVMSYAVSQRTHEIGIRKALGAQSWDVLRLIMGRSVLLILIGIGVGIGLALLLGGFMEALMFGVSPTDPTTFIGVAIMLVVIGLLASYLPARRAANVDPMMALRCE